MALAIKKRRRRIGFAMQPDMSDAMLEPHKKTV
jgi:hypothetical protein